MIRMAIRRLWGHPSTGPSGVVAQSNARIRPAISLSPGNSRASVSSRLGRPRLIGRLGRMVRRRRQHGARNRDSGRSLETLDGRAFRHVLRGAVVDASAILRPGTALTLEYLGLPRRDDGHVRPGWFTDGG